MRSNAQAVEDAWALIVAGAKPDAAKLLTGVTLQTLDRMKTAMRQLANRTPGCAPSRMTWKEAMRAAERVKAAQVTKQTHKAPSSEPEFVSALAGVLVMLDADLPGALMEFWKDNNVTRGVRQDDPTNRT